MNIRRILIGLVIVAGIYFIIDSLSQPGTSDLKGNFKETAAYRNPNNTGPIIRIYAVTADDTLWNEVQQYGDLMPYTKYGTTTVYFFKTSSGGPHEITPQEPFFDEKFETLCFAKYHKDAMGFVSLKRYPFYK